MVDIYRDEKRRVIYPPLFTGPEGDSCFSIYVIRWIKKRFFNFFFWNFRETTRYFPLRSQNSEYPRIFQVMGADQNARKLLSTDLANTKNYYCYYCSTLLIPRKVLQLHLNDCEQRLWSCEVPGCSFWGNSVDMKIHEKDRAESHVRLLKEEREQLHEAVLRGVSIN